MNHKEEIYHIFEQETVRRTKRLAKPLDPKLLLSKIVQYCRPQTAM